MPFISQRALSWLFTEPIQLAVAVAVAAASGSSLVSTTQPWLSLLSGAPLNHGPPSPILGSLFLAFVRRA